jgi:hypothetical protein
MNIHPKLQRSWPLALTLLAACAGTQSATTSAASVQPLGASAGGTSPTGSPTVSPPPAAVPANDKLPDPPASEIPGGPGWSIVTTAPEGISIDDLGRVYDSAFQPLAGSGALFKRKPPEKYAEFRHSASLVQDRVTLAATVRTWGLNADAYGTRRLASYRAEQITETYAVDDMSPPQKAPASASYYLAKIFFGRSFEVRLAGDEKQFNSNLAGSFLSGKLEGGLKSFAEKNRLEFTAVGRGLRPKTGTALYAKQPSEIEENYTVEGSVAVPVEVEYRLIPGRPLPGLESIPWRKQARYRVELSAVEAHGCDRTSACDLNVIVGQVGHDDKPKTYRGPDNLDLWEPRYQLLDTLEEGELSQGFSFEIADRNLTTSTLLGRCQVRVDGRRLKSVNESPDRRSRWTEMCGKAQVRLTVTADEVN